MGAITYNLLPLSSSPNLNPNLNPTPILSLVQVGAITYNLLPLSSSPNLNPTLSLVQVGAMGVGSSTLILIEGIGKAIRAMQDK